MVRIASAYKGFFPTIRTILITLLVLGLTVHVQSAYVSDEHLIVGLSPQPDDDGTGTLLQYAIATWHSMAAMKVTDALLIADSMDANGALSAYTSPTNIGAYIWSVLAAQQLDIITLDDAQARIAETLDAIEQLERHASSGQFYNWYDPITGNTLTNWPGSNATVCPFLSSVDNAWLAAALMMIENAMPPEWSQAQATLNGMDFDFYYDNHVGLMYGGYWPPEKQPPNASCDSGYTGHHYDILNTETRIISYVAIALGQVPPAHYYHLWRSLPGTCDWNWHEMMPTGSTASYVVNDALPHEPENIITINVYEGIMFEALMPNLFVPEAEWGPANWGINHPAYVQAQIEHGLQEAQYGYWGFSPASEPGGGYREYGVDAIGMYSDGYTSDADQTTVDYGFGACPGRPAQPLPGPDAYTSGVVTPHAVFLALEFAPNAVQANLQNLRHNFSIYDPAYGFYDAVQVDTGLVAERFLALDQGMIMAALANHLTGGDFREAFATVIESRIHPLLSQEIF